MPNLSLKPLENKNRENLKINVCDIESANWTKFLVIGFYDHSKKEFQYFLKLSKFLDYMIENYDKQDVFAHFGGKFDMIFLIKEILKNGKFQISEFIPRGSGILCFTMSDGHSRSVRFRDSSALLPFSLRTLTENFGVDHRKLDIDYTKIRRVTKKLITYLEHDCRGLAESLERFGNWELIQRAGMTYTIAGQALRVLRLFIKKPIPALSMSIDQKIRKSYFGGRTEIFKPIYENKSKPMFVYDVNSLYPTVMADCKHFPGGFLYVTRKFIKNALGFYRAKVFVPEQKIPPLGILHEGKYIFPCGNFEGMWTSIELEYAMTLGVKVEILEGYIFEDIGPVFHDFVHCLYDIRKSSRSSATDKFICKLLLNSCYGRMGINRDREQIVFGHGEGIKELREIKVGRKTYQLSTKEVQIETFSNVALASWVTSLARIYMHRNFFSKFPDSVFYTDTDSIHTTRNLDTSDRLGGLKLEYTCHSACYLLPKTYMAGDKIVMKGFDKKKIKDFTWDDFIECFRGDLDRLKIIQEPKFATFKTALRQGFLTMTKRSERKLKAKYDKRELFYGKNGWDSKPIVF